MVLLVLGLVGGCGRGSRVDRIVADESLFPKDLPEAVDFMRDECPEFAEAAGAQGEAMMASVTDASLSAAVPAGYRPQIEQVAARHGPPDSTSEMLHYYDDLSLRADSSGAVVDVIVRCTP